MASSFWFCLSITAFAVVRSERTRRVCDLSTDTCHELEVDPKQQTLGQQLLWKQTEVYGLTQLSYSEDSAAQSIKIYNPNDAVYDYYWFDQQRQKGIFKGRLRPQSQTATNSYRGHIFYFTATGTDDEVHRITVTKNVNDYIIPPTDDKLTHPFYLKLQEKQAFYADYFRENGYPWLSFYNRPKPELFMFNKEGTDAIGTVYSIESEHSFWHCIPDQALSAAAQSALCQSQGTISVNVEVISSAPKMFVIEHIISDAEVEMVNVHSRMFQSG